MKTLNATDAHPLGETAGSALVESADTPETDAYIAFAKTPHAQAVHIDFARKLERERNKYEEDLVTIVDAILKRDGRGVFNMSAIDRLAELHAAERERDEWRECAEGLILYAREARTKAKAVADKWGSEINRLNADIAHFERLKETSK